jgi:hypothetical protein
MAQSPPIVPASSASALYRDERTRGLTHEQAVAQCEHVFGVSAEQLDEQLERARRLIERSTAGLPPTAQGQSDEGK